jgi:hypothetical protein
MCIKKVRQVAKKEALEMAARAALEMALSLIRKVKVR